LQRFHFRKKEGEKTDASMKGHHTTPINEPPIEGTNVAEKPIMGALRGLSTASTNRADHVHGYPPQQHDSYRDAFSDS
jgi:hypothetical protein